jgi:ribosomal protein L10
VRGHRNEAFVLAWRDPVFRAGGVLVLGHYGINGPKTHELRDVCRRAGARYVVVKNTAGRLVLAGTPLAPLATELRFRSAFVLLPHAWHPALRAFVSYLDGGAFERPILHETKHSKYGPNNHVGSPRHYLRPRPGPHLGIRAGWIEGRALGAEDVRVLAALPPLDDLRARLLAALAAPLGRLLTALIQRSWRSASGRSRRVGPDPLR